MDIVEDTRTDAEWLTDLFEFEFCAECHQDAAEHWVGPDPLGLRHAYCKWRYLEDETEHEQLMNSGSTPVLGFEYILDSAGDILVPVWVTTTNGKVETIAKGYSVVMSYGDLGRLGTLEVDPLNDAWRPKLKWMPKCAREGCTRIWAGAPTRRDAAEMLASHYRNDHRIAVSLY